MVTLAMTDNRFNACSLAEEDVYKRQPFEREPLEKLAKEGELMSYVHEGFWQCMDNVREKAMLDKLLAENKAPWKRWDRQTPEIPDYAK